VFALPASSASGEVEIQRGDLSRILYDATNADGEQTPVGRSHLDRTQDAEPHGVIVPGLQRTVGCDNRLNGCRRG